MKSDFYKKNYGNNIWSVTCPSWYPDSFPGAAVMQSWVIKGSEKVLAFDSGIPEISGFETYLKETFGLPVMMVNSHGHWDHVGCNRQFTNIWLNKHDWPFLLQDIDGRKLYDSINDLPYSLHTINDGDIIHLGNRDVFALEIQGHTKGSIMIYDSFSKSLFSGDTVARRILYGMDSWTPLTTYFKGLKALSILDIQNIYSMHDTFPLPAEQPEKIIQNIISHICTTELTWEIPTTHDKYLRILLGKDERDSDFFDFVMPLDKKDIAIENLRLHGYF